MPCVGFGCMQLAANARDCRAAGGCHATALLPSSTFHPAGKSARSTNVRFLTWNLVHLLSFTFICRPDIPRRDSTGSVIAIGLSEIWKTIIEWCFYRNTGLERTCFYLSIASDCAEAGAGLLCALQGAVGPIHLVSACEQESTFSTPGSTSWRPVFSRSKYPPSIARIYHRIPQGGLLDEKGCRSDYVFLLSRYVVVVLRTGTFAD